eukprot:TCALIF_07489-PA protein Name:"Protein of unknown function" AED:0.33 eAED:0.33 QI:21/0.5/0/0.66/0.5/0.66/3/129/33
MLRFTEVIMESIGKMLKISLRVQVLMPFNSVPW